jgi:chemotaxis protein methyltransferase CheR
VGKFDIIFLRYVAIYFSLEFKQDLFSKLARSLNRPGAMIIGAVESLRGVSEDFEMNSHSGGYYYTV